MFIELLKFEVKFQSKQLAFPILFILFLLFGLLVSRQGYGGSNFNSPYHILNYAGLMTLASVFIVMFFSVSGILRDSKYNIEQLIYSSQLTKSDYFGSRFLGILSFSILTSCGFFIGFIIGPLIPGIDPSRIGSFTLISYVWALLVLVIPNLFFYASIIFSISILTRSSLATYVGAVLIYSLYFISAAYFNSPIMANSVPATQEAMAVAALVDPFALSAFFEQTQHWTLYQKNTQLISFSGHYMWNRIFWFMISTSLLIFTYWRFSFRKINSNKKIKKLNIEESVGFISYKPVKNIEFNQWVTFKSLLRMNLAGVFKNLTFIAMIIFWLVVVFMEIYFRVYDGGSYGDSWYPTTNILIELFSAPLPVFGLLTIVLMSGELVWRDRSVNINYIVDSSQTSNVIFYMSKLAALCLLPIILITTAILISICFQLFSGFYQFDISQYLSVYYFQGFRLMFYCALSLFILNVIPNKYLGMGMIGLVVMVLGKYSHVIGLEHPLFRLGYFDYPIFSNLTGYLSTTKFNHFAIHWFLFAFMVGLATIKIWQRGALKGGFKTLKSLFRVLKGKESTMVYSIGLAFITSGSVIYYNTNILNEYETHDDRLNHQENYERKFKKYENLEGLYPIGITTQVDLYPDDGSYDVSADYILKNKTKHPIDSILITGRMLFDTVSIENAEIVEMDEEFKIYLFRFKSSIKPNEQANFHFKLKHRSKGFERDILVIRNGTYLKHNNFDPIFGYRNGYEIDDDFERKQRGLPKREELSSMDQHMDNGLYFGRVSFDAVVSTIENQVALAPGDLVESWKESGRRFYHFSSPKPIVPTMVYFSADYKLQKSNYNKIEINQYYHPGHEYNLNVIEQSAKQALKYCEENFGGYPFKSIDIAEVPSYWPFGGFAHPGLISMVEDNLYLIDIRDTSKFNLVSKRTIHEVSHQWWGNTLTPKSVPGGSLMVEGFAKYCEAMIMQEMYGMKSLWQLSVNANGRYFRGRSLDNEKEPPLYLMKGKLFLAYGKSYTVMLALKDLLGEEKINGVLKTLVKKYGNSNEFIATSSNFIDELYAVSSEKDILLIDDWLKKVITYDLSIDEVTKSVYEDGMYKINLTIKSDRFETLENEEVRSIGLDEEIKVGIFSEHPRSASDNDIIYFDKHRINSRTQELEISISIKDGKTPKFISIDPYGARSDKNYMDNIVEIK